MCSKKFSVHCHNWVNICLSPSLFLWFNDSLWWIQEETLWSIGGVRFKSVLLLLAYFLCNFIIIITLYLFLWNILLSFDREYVELYKISTQKKRRHRNCHILHNDIGLKYWSVTKMKKLNEWGKVWKQTERLYIPRI